MCPCRMQTHTIETSIRHDRTMARPYPPDNTFLQMSRPQLDATLQWMLSHPHPPMSKIPNMLHKATFHPTRLMLKAVDSLQREQGAITRLLRSPTTPHHVRMLSLERRHDLTGDSENRQPPPLPPIQASDMGQDPYYPQSATAQLNAVFGRETRATRTIQSPPQLQQRSPSSRGPVPRFTKLESVHELAPKVNSQPAFRRANPEGGFISVSESLVLDRRC
jgi:hypothetical protein